MHSYIFVCVCMSMYVCLCVCVWGRGGGLLTRGKVFFFADLVILGEFDPLVRLNAGLAQPLSTLYAEAHST